MKDFIYEGPVRIIYGAGQYKELKKILMTAKN